MSPLPVPSGSLEVETEVSEEGAVEAGSGGLSLRCRVCETISGLSNMPSAEWVGPSGPVSSGDDITMTVDFQNDTTINSTLMFSLVHTSHAGWYICMGSVQTPAPVGTVITNSTPINVTVRSECKNHTSL